MKKVVSFFLKQGRFLGLLLCGLASLPAWAGSYELGLQCYEKGDYQMAAQYLRAAVAESGLQSQNPNLRYYLADSYMKLNRLAEAQAEYQMVMSLAPDSQAARLSQTALLHLRGYLERPVGNAWRQTGGLPGQTNSAGAKPDQYTGPMEAGEDYLDEVLQNGRVIRWSLAHMPLKIYVERSPLGIRNFQPAFVNQAAKAIVPWVEALNRQISYVLVNSPEQADIRITWVNTIDTRGHSADGGTAYTAGLTLPDTQNGQLRAMNIKLATFNIKGKPQTEKIIGAVAVHEMGHALGLLGHSSHADDIMSASNESLTTLSRRDVNTIRRLYRLPADINNLPATTHPYNEKRQQELASKLDEGIAKQEALVKRADTALNWLNLGVNYYIKARQLESEGKSGAETAAWYQKAILANNQAIRKEPKDPRAYHRRSLVYQALGDFNSALRDIEMSISLDRKEPVYHMLEAWYLANLGQTARARAALDTYLLYQPGAAGSDEVKRIQDAIQGNRTKS